MALVALACAACILPSSEDDEDSGGSSAAQTGSGPGETGTGGSGEGDSGTDGSGADGSGGTDSGNPAGGCGSAPYVPPAPADGTCAGSAALGSATKIAGPGGFSSAGGTGVATGDLDGDGHVDFAATENNQLLLFFGNGDGTFSEAMQLLSVEFTIFNVAPVVIADFNGDGMLDVAATGGYGGTDTLYPLIWLNNGDRSFGNANQDHSYDGVDTHGDGIKSDGTATVADLDGNDLPDIVYCGYGVKVFMSSCDAITTGTVVAFNDDGGNYISRNCEVLTLDDGDDIPDLIIQSYTFSPDYMGRTAVLHGNGDGSFSNEVDYDNFAEFAVAADVDADGAVDLVLHNTRENNEKLGLLAGKPDGTFALSPTTVELTAASSDYPTFVPGDFNGDGNIDIAMADGLVDMTAHLIRGNGDGTFEAPTQFSTAITSSPVMAVADFNEDGLQDLLGSDGQDASLSLSQCH
ncbi:MAG: VCBS repeat-containing protein [Nannocystaceae bacterium]|nr:VCBS repeat-containing protein [Nannocystaceae bacterium]